jgi:Beta-galactosidase
MNRRRFLVAASTSLLAGSPMLLRASRAAAAPATSARLAIADGFPEQPSATLQRRFELYRQLGFGVLRGGIGWWGLERSAGDWSEPTADKQRFFALAISSGFRLMFTTGALDAPPAWFLEAHPEARILNADGDYSKSYISLWYPDLYPLLNEKTDKIFAYLAQSGVLKAIDFIVVDLGYRNQPIYPLLGPCPEATPWFYDDHARAAFAGAMRAKYSSVAGANRIWGTNFADWTEVRPPRPGEHPGPLWDDTLLWYRDRKRAVLRWQVANYRRVLENHAPAGSRPVLIVTVAGSHIPPEEWSQVAQSGTPDCSTTIMSDSEFPMDLAKETGCWLQYTGAENVREVRYLRQYMKDHDITEPMWASNAGVERAARNPDHLVDIILANGLYGLDYVSSRFLFDPDGVTPNETFARLAGACARLRQALG